MPFVTQARTLRVRTGARYIRSSAPIAFGGASRVGSGSLCGVR